MATDNDRSMLEARQLRTSALRLQDQGRFVDARAMLERALAITERVHGREDGQVAAVAAQLAALYLLVPDNAKAEDASRHALAIMDKTIGGPITRARRWSGRDWRSSTNAPVSGRRRTAAPRGARGHREDARTRASLVRALPGDAGNAPRRRGRSERSGGDRSPRAGDHGRDRRARQPALRGRVEQPGLGLSQNQDYCGPRISSAARWRSANGCAGRRAITSARRCRTSGIVARERKDYATAGAYYTRALAIRERIVGPDHPDVAQLLNNLANIYRATGDDARSLETHFRALRIWEKQRGGPYQRGTLLSVGNIARTYAARGDIANALAFQRRADAIVETQLALNLAVGSERQKLAFVRSVVGAHRPDDFAASRTGARRSGRRRAGRAGAAAAQGARAGRDDRHARGRAAAGRRSRRTGRCSIGSNDDHRATGAARVERLRGRARGRAPDARSRSSRRARSSSKAS